MISLSQQSSANAMRTRSTLSHDNSNPYEQLGVLVSFIATLPSCFLVSGALSLSEEQPSFVAHLSINALMVNLEAINLERSPDPSVAIG
jgi:hypothetical protein